MNKNNIRKKISYIFSALLEALLSFFFWGFWSTFWLKLFIAFGIYIFIFPFLFEHISFPYDIPILSIGYLVLVMLEILREQVFAYKWQVLESPKSMTCPVCGTHVNLRNLSPKKFQRVPLRILYGEKWCEVSVFFRRPRLHLHCPHCGLDEIVCPYCDQPISEEDKKCPHCGKRVL